MIHIIYEKSGYNKSICMNNVYNWELTNVCVHSIRAITAMQTTTEVKLFHLLKKGKEVKVFTWNKTVIKEHASRIKAKRHLVKVRMI